ncbi:DUF932 domain-containing protein [Rhodococcus opacus]|uniref:DUF932 domain-containing protein n=1 Tax=Rhodococcus opacus TaxID=37919 RepID=UPI001F378793|nr:DUF932 domain-containing protein [Rhodococcus opacus]
MTYGRTVTATVCDNTMAIALGQARGQQVKIRHSRYSGLRIEEARQALSLVEETADEFTETLRRRSSTAVTDRQWFAFLDAWYPMPEEHGRARTIATRVREELVEMYRHDGLANTWQGTAYWCGPGGEHLGPPQAARQGCLARPRPHRPGASTNYAERHSWCPRGGIAAGRDLDSLATAPTARDTGDMRIVLILGADGLVLAELEPA